MELPELELPVYDYELPVLEDFVFEYEPFDVELTYFDFELPAFEPFEMYNFDYTASSVIVVR